MKMKEFNDTYTIEVTSYTKEKAFLIPNPEELGYVPGHEEVEDTTKQFQVYDKEGRLDFIYTTEDDGIFVQALIREFDIEDIDRLYEGG